jgi:ribosomal protein S18 acetylase RimI-like enzyme
MMLMLSFPGFVHFKAVVSDKVVGFIVAETEMEKDADWVTALGVSELFRCQGIGSALLSSCEKKLKKDYIRLCVRQSNLPAIHLYKQKGYYQKTVWQNYYINESALVMEKRRVNVDIHADSVYDR